MLGGLMDTLGMVGLLLGLLAHLAYNIYENRLGSVADVQRAVDDAHSRLDGVGVILYRKADEDWENIDEEYLRDMLFNGHRVQFPGDFEQEDYHPTDDDLSSDERSDKRKARK